MSEKSIWTVFDEDGRISMSNKVFDDPEGNYGRVLAERGMKFVNHGGGRHANLDCHYVWRGELSERPAMKAAIDRTQIGIGEKDGARITGIPKGANLTIMAGGLEFFSETVSARQIDLSAPVPGVYTVILHKWPYRDFRAELVAK